ncbi:MAG: SPOR domain-containing protein, partial [Desulfobacteraceae bacterium]|nr:SPOR domain-containing protein [Desulfobacteraceae bacterium]
AAVPVKTSRKTATLNKTALNKPLFKDKGSISKGAKGTKKEKQISAKAAGELSGEKLRKVPLKKITNKKLSKIEDSSEKKKESLAGVKVMPGMYTIQVAAYKSFADAVTQMAILEKKGFASYRTLGKKQGVTWYRVRVGSFSTRDEANLYLGKLKQAKIDAMIIKKE